MHYVKRRNIIVWFSMIGLFYLLLTKIDLIINYDLYNFGLKFNLQWAQPYWLTLTACFWGLAALSVASYWLESRNKNIFLCILLVLTIVLPFYFGFEDVLYFLWRGQFPAANVEWTWYWLNRYFPPWNTEKHIIYSSIGLVLLASFWGLFLGKKWVSFSFSYLKKYKPKKAS
jgi:hypothetical protein